MALIRWNDDRLDGFAADFKVTDAAVEHMTIEVTKVKGRVENLERTQAQGISNRLQWWMIAATTVSNSLTALIVYVITKGK